MKTMKQMMVALAVVGLWGCGGGGGAGGPNYPQHPAGTADSLLLPFVTAAGELQLFDPQMPDTAPVTVDSGLPSPQHYGSLDDIQLGASIFPILAGSYDAASHSIVDGHYRYVWYFKDGTPYRVDLSPDAVHTPAQFSSITDACGWNGVAGDYQTPLNTLILVQTAGVDTACNTEDDTAALVKVGAAADDAGVAAAASLILFESVPAADGALQKILTIDFASGEFAVHAPDLSTSDTLLTADVSLSIGGGPDQSRTRQYFRFVPMGETALTLYRYDAADDGLTPVHTHADSTGTFLLADATHAYFSDGLDVYRVAHSATTPELLHTLDVPFDTVFLTTNRIVFQLDLGAGMRSIESLPKIGGEVRTTLQAATDEALDIVATADELVYFERGDVFTAISAHRIRGDGTGPVAYADARWGAQVQDPDFNIGATAVERLVRTLLLGEADAAGTVTVSPVDARTGIKGPVLGTLDGATQGIGRGIGRNVLVNAFIDRDADRVGDDFDVYSADVQAKGSARPAATTPDQDDSTGP